MASEILLVSSAVAALVIGLVIGYKIRPQTATGELRSIRDQFQEAKRDSHSLQEKLEASKETAAAAESRVELLKDEKSNLTSSIEDLREKLEAKREEVATSKSSLKALREQIKEREEFFESQRQLSEKQQEATAKKLLKEITTETLEIQNKERKAREEADEQVRKERQKAFESEFTKLSKHLKEIEEARAKEGQSFKDQFKEILAQSGQIQKEAVRLTTALENVKVQGDFGEIRLERLLEYSGLKEGVHYDSQAHVGTEDGALRPDVVVNLPDDNKIIIDSKAPLNAFFAALEASDATERRKHLKGYAKAIRSHVQTLRSKAYQDQFKGAAPFTVMFLPSESAFIAALEADSSLLDYAIQKEVLIATSSTLVGLLKVVHVGHRQLEAVEKSEKILKIARDVYDRGHKLVDLTTKIGGGLKTATDSYNNVIKSYESRFLPKGRELAGFAASSKALPEAAGFKEMPDVRDASKDKLAEGSQLMAGKD